MSERSERTRTYEWDDPTPGAQAALTLSGIEYLQAMSRGDLPRPPIAATLGFDGFEVDEGRATFFITPQEWHYNPIGTVHGGLAATLFDSALGCAIHSILPAGTGYTTVDLSVKFLRPLTKDTGPVRCEANVVHVGGRIATAEARLVDGAGRLYGHATTTCMVFRPEGATP
jgi:uncharacterized protein (TIGR00369 family)